MIETYNTMFGMSFSVSAQIGLINCPSYSRDSRSATSETPRVLDRLHTAPPRGLANVATAVAEMRPRDVNHRSLYRVGAARTNGCASPPRIWPNITTP